MPDWSTCLVSDNLAAKATGLATYIIRLDRIAAIHMGSVTHSIVGLDTAITASTLITLSVSMSHKQ